MGDQPAERQNAIKMPLTASAACSGKVPYLSDAPRPSRGSQADSQDVQVDRASPKEVIMTRALHSLAGRATLPAPGAALAILAVAGVLAGCGSSSHSASASKKSASTTGQSTPASAATQIKRDWTTFFAASTPPAKKASLLQNGQAFAQTIAAQSKSPLAAQSQAKVTKVDLTGPSTARVTYTILLGGKPALSNQRGTAIKSGSTWKVSDASFCSLLALEGSAPPNCPKG
jgi:hypothetical protein